MLTDSSRRRSHHTVQSWPFHWPRCFRQLQIAGQELTGILFSPALIPSLPIFVLRAEPLIKEHLPGDVINSGGSGEVILDAPERKVTFLGDVADCLVKIRETLEIDTIGLLPDLRQLGC